MTGEPNGADDDEVLIPQPDTELPRLRGTSPHRLGRQATSWSALVVGLLFTLVVAYLGTDGGTGDALVPILAVTVASGLFQVVSVIAGNSANKVDPNLVKNIARRLLAAQIRVNSATLAAEQGQQSSNASGSRVALGLISVELSHVQEHLGESILTWRDLRPDLFEEGSADGGL